MVIGAIPFSANAHSWTCEHNGLIREVSIRSDGTNAVPCTVEYSKITEGIEAQTLWSAENVEGYCEQKADDFIAKLSSWGWQCTQDPEHAPETPEAPILQ